MNHLSLSVQWFFMMSVAFTIWQFYKAAGQSKRVLLWLLIWMLLQSILGLGGFYQVADAVPPRFILLLGPGLLISSILFFTRGGRQFAEGLALAQLTLLHSVRIPVEITLYFVYLAGLIPDLMTFEGFNFDIFSGLTAPMVYYWFFHRKKMGRKALLVWNYVCLALLLNILTIAALSAKTPFQQLAHAQPNVGVSFFPFVWLPSVVVPLVLFSHLAAIRQLLRAQKEK
jgi:hypothetical protein